MKKMIKTIICIIIASIAISLCAFGNETDTINSLKDLLNSISAFVQKQIVDEEEYKEKTWHDFTTDDFMYYGIIHSDLKMVGDFLSLLEDNGIYIKLPELLIDSNDERDYYSFEIADSFWLTYIEYIENENVLISLEVPNEYKPRDEALTLMISSVLSIDKEQAEELYSLLQYNVIDRWADLDVNEYHLSLFSTEWFQQLDITVKPDL